MKKTVASPRPIAAGLLASPLLVDILRDAGVSHVDFLVDFVLCRGVYGRWSESQHKATPHWFRHAAAGAIVKPGQAALRPGLTVENELDGVRDRRHNRLIPDLTARLRNGVLDVKMTFNDTYEVRTESGLGELRITGELPHTVRGTLVGMPMSRLIDVPLLDDPRYRIRRVTDREDGTGTSVWFSAKPVPFSCGTSPGAIASDE